MFRKSSVKFVTLLVRSYTKEQSITEDNRITDGHMRKKMARELAIDDTLYV